MAQVIYYEAPGYASGGLSIKTDKDKAVVEIAVGFETNLKLVVPIDADPRTYVQLMKLEEFMNGIMKTTDKIPEEIYFKERV